MDLPPDGLFTRRSAVFAGLPDRKLKLQVAGDEIVRLRRGVYLPAADLKASDPEYRHLRQVEAAVEQVHAGTVVSHVSAALIHGLPIWGIALDRVHVTKNKSDGGHVTKHLHTHCFPMAEDEQQVVNGVLVTSVGRTLFDLARTVSFEKAVVTADAALHRDLISRQELAGEAERHEKRRGAVKARQALNFADGLSESVGESRSRFQMHQQGLPTPTLQFAIHDRNGIFVARADFGFEAQRVVGEFDGKGKYLRYLRPGESPGDAVFREKRREDAVRFEQFQMARWGWDDLSRPEVWTGRLRAMIDRS